MPEMSSGAEGIDMVAGTEIMISRIGIITLELMSSLRTDLNWTEGEPLTILG